MWLGGLFQLFSLHVELKLQYQSFADGQSDQGNMLHISDQKSAVQANLSNEIVPIPASQLGLSCLGGEHLILISLALTRNLCLPIQPALTFQQLMVFGNKFLAQLPLKLSSIHCKIFDWIFKTIDINRQFAKSQNFLLHLANIDTLKGFIIFIIIQSF